MLKSVINTVISQNKMTYIGRVQIHCDKTKKYLYSHSTGIHRLTKFDAKNDALKLKKDLLMSL